MALSLSKSMIVIGLIMLMAGIGLQKSRTSTCQSMLKVNLLRLVLPRVSLIFQNGLCIALLSSVTGDGAVGRDRYLQDFHKKPRQIKMVSILYIVSNRLCLLVPFFHKHLSLSK